MSTSVIIIVLFIFFLPLTRYIAYNIGVIVDEEFHNHQTDIFMSNNFSYWNPKLTTFPGLFIITTLFNKIFELMSLPLLPYRYISFFSSVLLVVRLKHFCEKLFIFDYKGTYITMIIFFLPINFFFYFLYYTETISLFCVVNFLYYSLFEKNNSNKGFDFKYFLYAFLVVFVRQNNIIWVNFLNLKYFIDVIKDIFASNNFEDNENVERQIENTANINIIDLNSSSALRRNENKNQGLFSKLIDMIVIYKEIVIIDIIFVCFLLWNNFSIVLGDNNNHYFAFHLGQLNHFLVFIFFFFPSLNINLIVFLQNLILIKKLKYLVIFTFVYGVLLINETFFLIRHPFIQNDNRHYAYYYFSKICNNFYMNHLKIIYISILTSVIIYNFFYKASESNDETKKKQSWIKNINSYYLAYFICLCLILVPTPLFDFRYLSLCYSVLLLILALEKSSILQEILISENIVFSIIVNAVTLYIFLFKPFKNDYFNEMSRFMW